MGSNGGVLSVQRTLEQPVALVESGPIGGCIGAAAYAQALGLDKVIAFDMGGTTAKCALIQQGRFDVQPIYYVGGYDRGFPLKTAVLDIVEVGAGGGSIAAVDAQGRLTVGPRSAGSEPGPVAYGRGGTEPTVTDANLVLGRISDDTFLGGRLRLDRDASAAAIAARVAAPLGYDGPDGIDVAAQGILDLGAAAMAGAIKEITIERGLDVRDFALMVFGGGGPLFGSTLARQLRIPTVVVPPHPGNFSTLGMLIAGARIDLSRTMPTALDDASLRGVDDAFEDLERTARATMQAELDTASVGFDRWLEARYRGQTHTVRVAYAPGAGAAAFRATFDDAYLRRYGHVNPDCAVEVLGLRLGASAGVPRPELAELVAAPVGDHPAPVGSRAVYFHGHGRLDTPRWRRDALPPGHAVDGPAIIEEFSATTIVQPGDRAVVGSLGEIRVERDAREQA
jgi:N-methylhydantoinase A